MKKLFFIIPFVLLLFVFILISGYRFTAKSAVEAHSFLEKGSKLVQKVNSHFGDIYIYKTKDYYLTIAPEKKGLFWVAPSSTTTKDINDKKDKVRTIGWASYSGSEKLGTVIVVEVLDDKVAYIEAGPEFERIKKKVIKGEYLVFEWNRGYFHHNIKPVAFSKNGEKLYIYGYDPLTPNFIDTKELRWHRVE